MPVYNEEWVEDLHDYMWCGQSTQQFRWDDLSSLDYHWNRMCRIGFLPWEFFRMLDNRWCIREKREDDPEEQDTDTLRSVFAQGSDS